jgi:deoxyribonuclease V
MNRLEGRLLERHLFEVQREIASRVILEDSYSTEAVAGVDQAFDGDLVFSGAVVLGPSLEVVGKASCSVKISFPYIPGLLSFREGPAAIRAVRKLFIRPTLIFVDGCGINHPRMAGLATYVGVALDLPTIGVCKSVLCGEFELPERAGESTPLFYNGKQVGHLLRSKKACRPIVIAPGHRVSVDASLELAREYLADHKLPEPCRQAHEYVNQVKRSRMNDLDKSLYKTLYKTST